MVGPTRVTDKMVAATELLESGLEAYFDGKYFAAIHLAGGAETIFGGYVTRTKAKNALKSLRDAAAGISKIIAEAGQHATKDEMYDRMVNARNRIKHLDDEGDDDIGFDPKVEAEDLLNRAISDYYHLMQGLPLPESELLRRFNNRRWESG